MLIKEEKIGEERERFIYQFFALKMFVQVVLLLGVVFCPSVTNAAITPMLLNKFELGHAGFSTLLRTWNLNSTSWALVISCFNPIPGTTDTVVAVPNIQYQLTTPITPQVLTNKIVWPNGIIPADQLVPYSFLVPSGFLVPGKTNGNLHFISANADPVSLVRQEKTNWFYHGAEFKDMDGDGLIDIVTGRVNVPLIGRSTSELIWLKNPGGTTITGPWNSSVLIPESAPDIQLQFASIDSLQVLFGNSYFSQKLQMLWSDSNVFWNDTKLLHVRHVDYESHPYFGVQLNVDLNGDQRLDLLVTINDENNGSLVAYELPPAGEIRTGQFVKHILASGFKPLTHAKGRGAPGQPAAVQIYPFSERKKPSILLSGDDDGGVYLFEALHDDDPNNWEYSKQIIYQAEKSTIGQLSVEDVDNDGHPELFVPIYNEGQVLIYRLVAS